MNELTIESLVKFRVVLTSNHRLKRHVETWNNQNVISGGLK